MTKAEAINILDSLGTPHSSDEEIDHSRADEVLVRFLKDNGHSDVAEAWERARDRVGFWYA